MDTQPTSLDALNAATATAAAVNAATANAAAVSDATARFDRTLLAVFGIMVSLIVLLSALLVTTPAQADAGPDTGQAVANPVSPTPNR